MPADVSRAFVDTNVLLYAYDRSAGSQHDRAASLVGQLGADRRGAVSVQVLQEFYVNATRKIEQRLDHETAVARLRALSCWSVHAPSAGDVLTAAGLATTAKLSFWDAMIVTSAQALGCETLWSEDLNDRQRIGGVTVRSPFRDAA